MERDYRLEKENIVLELKAILDTGSESIIGKSYKAREDEGGQIMVQPRY